MEQVQHLAMEEQELEEPDSPDEQDPDKIKIHELVPAAILGKAR